MWLEIYFLINCFIAGYEFGAELQHEYAAGNKAKAIIATVGLLLFSSLFIVMVIVVLLYQMMFGKKEEEVAK